MRDHLHRRTGLLQLLFAPEMPLSICCRCRWRVQVLQRLVQPGRPAEPPDVPAARARRVLRPAGCSPQASHPAHAAGQVPQGGAHFHGDSVRLSISCARKRTLIDPPALLTGVLCTVILALLLLRCWQAGTQPCTSAALVSLIMMNSKLIRPHAFASAISRLRQSCFCIGTQQY